MAKWTQGVVSGTPADTSNLKVNNEVSQPTNTKQPQEKSIFVGMTKAEAAQDGLYDVFSIYNTNGDEKIGVDEFAKYLSDTDIDYQCMEDKQTEILLQKCLEQKYSMEEIEKYCKDNNIDLQQEILNSPDLIKLLYSAKEGEKDIYKKYRNTLLENAYNKIIEENNLSEKSDIAQIINNLRKYGFSEELINEFISSKNISNVEYQDNNSLDNIESDIADTYVKFNNKSITKEDKLNIIKEMEQKLGVSFEGTYNEQSSEEINKVFIIISALIIDAADKESVYIDVENNKYSTLEEKRKYIEENIKGKTSDEIIKTFSGRLSHVLSEREGLTKYNFVKPIYNTINDENRYLNWLKKEYNIDEKDYNYTNTKQAIEQIVKDKNIDIPKLQNKYKNESKQVQNDVKSSLVYIYSEYNKIKSEYEKLIITKQSDLNDADYKKLKEYEKIKELYNSYIANNNLEEIVNDYSKNGVTNSEISSIDKAKEVLEKNKDVCSAHDIKREAVRQFNEEKLAPVADLLDKYRGDLQLRGLSQEQALDKIDQSIKQAEQNGDTERVNELKRIRQIYTDIDESQFIELGNIKIDINDNQKCFEQLDKIVGDYLKSHPDITVEEAIRDIYTYVSFNGNETLVMLMSNYINDKINKGEIDYSKLQSNEFDIVSVVDETTSEETTTQITQSNQNADIVNAHIEYGYHTEAALTGASLNKNEEIVNNAQAYIEKHPEKFSEEFKNKILKNCEQTRAEIKAEAEKKQNELSQKSVKKFFSENTENTPETTSVGNTILQPNVVEQENIVMPELEEVIKISDENASVQNVDIESVVMHPQIQSLPVNKNEETLLVTKDDKIVDFNKAINSRAELNRVFDLLVDKSVKLAPQEEKILIKAWFSAQTPIQALTDATSNIDLIKLIIKYIPDYNVHLKNRPTTIKIIYQQIADSYGYETEAS